VTGPVGNGTQTTIGYGAQAHPLQGPQMRESLTVCCPRAAQLAQRMAHCGRCRPLAVLPAASPLGVWLTRWHGLRRRLGHGVE
jgi:hypothetical protein